MRSPQEISALRERAIQLRREGKSRRQIKEILGPMSNSTLDEALKGEPPPEWTRRPHGGCCRDRCPNRPRARHRRGHRLLVRGLEEQTSPAY